MTGTILRLASVFFILVVGLLSFTTFKNSSNLHGKATTAVSANDSPATWEYRTIDDATPELLASQASKLAGESWEMIDMEQDVADSHHHWVGLLKRVKRQSGN